MSWNGSGVFTRLYNWVTDAAGAIPITPSRMDNDTNDIVAGLNNCLTRDGQGKPSANLTMNGFKLTGLAAATTAGDALSYGGPGSFTQATATPSAPLPASGVGSFAYKASGSYGGGVGLIDGTYNIGLYSVGGALNIGFGTSLGALTGKASIDAIGTMDLAGGLYVSGAGGNYTGLNAVGMPLVINSSGSSNVKISFQDNTVTRGFIGAEASYCFTTVNASNTLYTLRIDNSGNANFSGSCGATQFNGSGFGLTGTAASLTAGAASTDNQHYGVGQSWQNVIGSRVNGGTYTNPSSTKAMTVYVRGNHSSLGIPSIQATVVSGSVEVGYQQLGQAGSGVSGDLCLSFPVPPSTNYTVTSSTGVAVWSEFV